MPRRRAHLPHRPFFDRAPVRQSRQLIRPRLFFQQFALGVDLPVQTDDPATYPYPCQQFSRVKRLGQIVVSAGGQTLHYTLFLAVTSEHDDVGIGAIRLGADALAEFQSGESGIFQSVITVEAA